MSEAPSTSGSPDSGEPTAGPAQDSQVPAGAPRRELDTAEPEAGSKTGELPGVLTHGQEDEDLSDVLFGEPEDKGEPDKDQEPKRKKTKGRDRPRDPATGQFLKAEGEPGNAQPEGAKPEAPAGSEPEPGPDAGQKFSFGGETWESQEAAEQNFRSLRGTYKATETRANENWAAYEAWKRYAESEIAARDARIAELTEKQHGSGKAADAQAPSGEEAQVSKDDLLKSIDMDAYAYLVTKGGPAAGAEYLVESLTEIVRDKMIPGEISKLRTEIQEQLEKELAPGREAREQQDTARAMTMAASQLAALQTRDGKPAFPELGDAAKVEDIARIWAREASDEQDAERRLQKLRTPAGLLNAIAFYRLVKGFEAPESPNPTTAAPGNGQDLPTEPVSPGAAATVDAGPRSGFTPGQKADGPFGDLVAELDKGDMIDTQLGFARNR